MASLRNVNTSLVVWAVSAVALAAPAWAAVRVSIQVSPNVLNLASMGMVVTVHTDIAYGQVSGESMTLNGVAIHHWKADNRGNFVAKFLMDEIKGLDDLKIGKPNTFTLAGLTREGDEFGGSTEVLVVNKVPKR